MPQFCGLIGRKTNCDPVPLQTIAVHADVRGLAAAITAELMYENLSQEVIECEFIFPLTDTSAVYKLEVEISGRTIVAECQPRTQAEQAYHDAISTGHLGALLQSEANASDVFRILLGNLPGKEKAKVKIGYVQPLDREPDGVLTFNLPNVLNPRYFPTDFINNPAKLEGKFQQNIRYVAVSAISYEMKFDAKFNLGISGQISTIAPGSNADKLDINFSDDRLTATVGLRSKFVPDHDFRLHVTPADPWRPVVYVEPGLAKPDGASATSWLNYFVASAWFEPKQRENADKAGSAGSNNEYWFVVDRSGSMSGSNIKHAKEALLLFVKSLPVSCKFNVLGFGSRFECLFPDGSVEYTEENAAMAVKHSKELEANMGGTEILEPLKYIYSKQLEKASRFIIVLTDGDVANTDEVIRMARKNAHSSRIFAIGIGEGASTALVNGIARASGGLSEFVRSSQDRLQAKVVSLLKATTNPAAENVKLDWQFENATLASLSPSQLSSAVYHGHMISQFAIFDKTGESFEGAAKLSATINGNQVEFDLKFVPSALTYSEANDAMPLHRLAAKARLLEIENDNEGEMQKSKNEEAVAISVATGVLCKQTSLVAVDRSGDPVKNTEGAPQFISIERPFVQNQERFRGIGCAMSRSATCSLDGQMMLDDAVMDRSECLSKKSSKFLSRPSYQTRSSQVASCSVNKSRAGFSFGFPRIFSAIGEKLFGSGAQQKETRSVSGSSSSEENSGSSYSLEDLISWQKINGSWQLTAGLAKFVGENVDKVRQMCTECLPSPIKFTPNDEFIATLIGVALLRHKFASKKDEWEMIEEKAVSFLMSGFDGLTSNQLDETVHAFAKKASL